MQDLGRGRLTDPQIDVAVEDATDLSARVARAEARLFRVGVYLTVHAESETELADEVAAVRALAASLLVDTCTLSYRAAQAWATTLPLGLDLIRVARTFDTTALAAAFPFDSPHLPAADPAQAARPRGVLYGRDAASGLLFVDRFGPEAHNHNLVVLGRSGAGKSYLVKTEILRALYRGIEQVVIDPEDEYRRLCQSVGGANIRLGVPGVRLNPFDLEVHTRADGRRSAPTDALTRRKLFLDTLIQVLLGDQTPAQRSALDAALTTTYAAAGITDDPAIEPALLAVGLPASAPATENHCSHTGRTPARPAAHLRGDAVDGRDALHAGVQVVGAQHVHPHPEHGDCIPEEDGGAANLLPEPPAPAATPAPAVELPSNVVPLFGRRSG